MKISPLVLGGLLMASTSSAQLTNDTTYLDTVRNQMMNDNEIIQKIRNMDTWNYDLEFGPAGEPIYKERKRHICFGLCGMG